MTLYPPFFPKYYIDTHRHSKLSTTMLGVDFPPCHNQTHLLRCAGLPRSTMTRRPILRKRTWNPRRRAVKPRRRNQTKNPRISLRRQRRRRKPSRFLFQAFCLPHAHLEVWHKAVKNILVSKFQLFFVGQIFAQTQCFVETWCVCVCVRHLEDTLWCLPDWGP